MPLGAQSRSRLVQNEAIRTAQTLLQIGREVASQGLARGLNQGIRIGIHEAVGIRIGVNRRFLLEGRDHTGLGIDPACAVDQILVAVQGAPRVLDAEHQGGFRRIPVQDGRDAVDGIVPVKCRNLVETQQQFRPGPLYLHHLPAGRRFQFGLRCLPVRLATGVEAADGHRLGVEDLGRTQSIQAAMEGRRPGGGIAAF